MTATEKLFEEGFKRLIAAHPYLKIDVDWHTGIAILSCLQLSLRHPSNTGPTAQTARCFCDQLIASIEKVDATLAKLLRLGDDPQHDVPR